MVVSFKNRDEALDPSKRFLSYSVIPQEITTRGLDKFVTTSTQTFFDQFEIKTDFLDQDSVTWDNMKGSKKFLEL